MQLDPSILTVLAGVSSTLGFLSLLAYFFLATRTHKAERSVREIVEGEGLFNADQVLQILREFKDEETRLEALISLANLERNKANAMLRKIDADIGVERLQQSSYRHHRQFSSIGGVLFLLLGVAGIAFAPAEKRGSVITVPALISPLDGAEFANFPRTLDLEWQPVEGARSYAVEVEIQDPVDGSWHPHPFGFSRRIVDSSNFEFDFVGSQPGRWRVSAIDLLGKDGPSSNWSHFVFTDGTQEAAGDSGEGDNRPETSDNPSGPTPESGPPPIHQETPHPSPSGGSAPNLRSPPATEDNSREGEEEYTHAVSGGVEFQDGAVDELPSSGAGYDPEKCNAIAGNWHNVSDPRKFSGNMKEILVSAEKQPVRMDLRCGEASVVGTIAFKGKVREVVKGHVAGNDVYISYGDGNSYDKYNDFSGKVLSDGRLRLKSLIPSFGGGDTTLVYLFVRDEPH